MEKSEAEKEQKTEVEMLLWELGVMLNQKSFDVKDEELKGFLKEMDANVREIEKMLRKGKIDRNDTTKDIRKKFEYYNKSEFQPLYEKFCEHINKFRREENLPILALPPFLITALADGLHQSSELMKETQTDETVRAFYLHDYRVALKKIVKFMGIEVVEEK